MRKLFFATALSLALGMSANAQQTIRPVGYRGAFAPAPTAMWTDGWTNWDPQNASYGAPTVTVNSVITTNTTWTASNVYLLSGVIYVKNGATLTIEPGTIIRGDKNTPNSCLVISRGSKINAVGTSTNPIVFTSNQATGSRNIGDWGGVIILGNAPINATGGVNNIEGLTPSADNQYGGTNPNDNSGNFKYVRIEYGGYVFAPNNEINGLTMGGVGRGTQISFVQTSFTNDDAFEWFGGTVNCSNLVSYRDLDDCFDTDFGFSGTVQFCLGVRDPQISDNPAVSTSEGFESDNDPTGSTASPLTRAIFSNVTIVGPYRGNKSATVASGFRRGARVRRNSNLRIVNSILMDYATGVFIDGAATVNNALAAYSSTGSNMAFKNNIIANVGLNANGSGKFTEKNVVSFNIDSFIVANGNDTVATTNSLLTNPYSFTNPDYRPASNSLALWNSDYGNAWLDARILSQGPSVSSPVVGFPNGSSNVCMFMGTGDTAWFTINPQMNVSNYIWSFGGGSTVVKGQGSTRVGVLLSATAPKTFSISFSNAFSTDTRTFTMLNKAPYVGTTISSSATDLCPLINTPTTFTLTCAPIAGCTSYLWTVPTGVVISSGQGTTAITCTVNSSFTIGNASVTGVAPCGNTLITYYPLRKLVAPSSLTGPATMCDGDDVTFSIPAVTGATYTWVLPSGLIPTSNLNSNTINVHVSGTFVGGVLRSQYTLSGCGTSDQAKMSIGTAGCMQGGGISKVTKTAGEPSFTAYPNPAQTAITVTFASANTTDQAVVEVLDLTGKVILRQVITNSNNGRFNETLSLESVKSGFYFVKYTIGGESSTLKVAVSK